MDHLVGSCSSCDVMNFYHFQPSYLGLLNWTPVLKILIRQIIYNNSLLYEGLGSDRHFLFPISFFLYACTRNIRRMIILFFLFLLFQMIPYSCITLFNHRFQYNHKPSLSSLTDQVTEAQQVKQLAKIINQVTTRTGRQWGVP